MSIPLAVAGDIIDASGVAPEIEALLPAGVRVRQLTVRTLLTGMLLILDDRRPAFLTGIRAALIALPDADQARLGVTADWKTGPHQLTYRQVEHTHRLIAKALGKDTPIALWITCLLAVRNQRILTAWHARQQDNARRAAAGHPPRTRKKRRAATAA